MDLSISVYRITATALVGEEAGCEFLVTQEVWHLDGAQHEGDRDFAIGLEFDLHPIGLVYPSQRYVRPTAFEEAYNWVLDSEDVCAEDKPRLLDLLNDLEDDPELYIRFSWRSGS